MARTRRKQKKLVDPYAEREAAKYGRPIKSREFIMAYLEEVGHPMSEAELVKALEIDDPEDQRALGARLRAMVRDGQLVRNRRGIYGLASKMDLVRGRVVGHPDGFGFLVADEGGDDVFLSPREMRTVFHGDRVIARVVGVDRRGRREGAIVDVLERNTQSLVGRYFDESGVGFVTPSNQRISQDVVIPPEHRGEARSGQMVVVEIVEQPGRRTQAIGRIVEVLGDHMAPGMEVEIALRSHDLPFEWPAAIEEEVAALPAGVGPDDLDGREDIRDLPLVTIDGEDSKDFDDAVFCERKGRGWRLIVAIADVSHYVDPWSALDEEARLRGNSVYFPQQVIPMLPEALSNDLCSIRPRVDRLCLACEISVTPAGNLRSYRFFAAVMHSHARLTYGQVARMIDEGPADEDEAAVHPHILELHALYGALRKARERRGAIDFERPETRIVFNEERKIERIVPVERNDAHRLIEECMIMANRAAAEFLLEHEIAALYRTHCEPMPDKLADLKTFLGELGLQLGGGSRPRPRDYARLLRTVADRPDRDLIETVLLRSLSQAVYSPENGGHFGLALEAYTHFTSPIRRYPDLVVHRAIHHLISGGAPGSFVYNAGDMEGMGNHCSMTERRADEATRSAVDWLKCEFMMDRIGEVFPGIVTGVTSFGLFVELKDIHVEGLVHVTALDNDYYHFDATGHRLRGERSGVEYRLADPIEVRVVRVDLDERKIDFALERGPEGGREAGGATKAKPPRKRGGRRRGRRR